LNDHKVQYILYSLQEFIILAILILNSKKNLSFLVGSKGTALYAPA